jgi:hypothetical protein
MERTVGFKAPGRAWRGVTGAGTLDVPRLRAVLFDLDDTLINWRQAEDGAMGDLARDEFARLGVTEAEVRRVYAGVMEENFRAFQEHAFAAVVETAERALAHTGKRELVLGGGVACNARLQSMARAMCEARGVAFFAPPRDLLVDNGAMIAWQGLLQLAAGATVAVEASVVHPYQRTDQVEVSWR